MEIGINNFRKMGIDRNPKRQNLLGLFLPISKGSLGYCYESGDRWKRQALKGHTHTCAITGLA